MDDLLIKNATIINSDKIIRGNIVVNNGKIRDILEIGECVDTYKVMNLDGKLLFPGFIDSHVHFNDPGYTWREDFYTGTMAAAIGGITTVIDMPLNNKPPLYNKKQYYNKLGLIKDKAFVDYGMWGAVLNYNLGELEELDKVGALAFKCFTCNPGEDYTSVNLDEIEEAMKIISDTNGFLAFHCEDYKIVEELENEKIKDGKFTLKDYIESRPVDAELKAVEDVIEIAKRTNCKIHICHVSHSDVAEVIKKAKNDNVKITAETCSHYLIYSEEDFYQKGAILKCSPPLRCREAVMKMWSYIEDGTIDFICSDHSPATEEEKCTSGVRGAFGAWGGMNSVQHTGEIIFDYIVNKKGQSETVVAKLLSKRVAEIFGINYCKGEINIGYDADFTVIDAEKQWCISNEDLKTKTKSSIFSGLEGKGKILDVIVRGKLIIENGQLVSEPGYGKLIKR